ncbi:MAG: c-type cytochrome [Rhodobacterales bacterium]
MTPTFRFTPVFAEMQSRPARRLKRKIAKLAAFVFITGAMQMAYVPAANAAKFDLPKGPNRGLIYAKCRTCHDLQYVVESKGLSDGSWDGLLDDMEGFGVELTSEERDKIYQYLITYMGKNPPPAAPVETATTPDVVELQGGTLFADNCTSCHQEDAMGLEGTFPPLAGNSDLFLAEDFPVKVLLNGMSGTITVNGQNYEGEMPSFGHLEDAEIAALVNFLRGNFGNDVTAHPDIGPLSADMVAKLRDSEMDPDQVLAYRASLK